MCGAIEVHDDLEIAHNRHLFRTNPLRYSVLHFVKALPVDVASPVSLGEHPAARRSFWLMLRNFDSSALNNKVFVAFLPLPRHLLPITLPLLFWYGA